MGKTAFSFLVFWATTSLFSCAPNSNGVPQGRPKDTVSEQTIKNLTSNVWCQLNTTTNTTEYRWTFNEKLRVTSKNVTTQDEETFTWTINDYNVLTVNITENAPLFTKQVIYGYNVNLHKRTMRWNESGADTVYFIECD